jgi:hypothetical protein
MMEFHSLKRKITIGLFTILPITVGAEKIGNENGDKTTDANKTPTHYKAKTDGYETNSILTEIKVPQLNRFRGISYPSAESKPIANTITNETVRGLLTEAEKYKIDLSAMRTFSNVYLQDAFPKLLIELMDKGYPMSSEFIQKGMESFLLNKFNGTANGKNFPDGFGEELSEENVRIALNLLCNSFDLELERYPGFYQNYLNFIDPEKKIITEVHEYYDESLGEKLLKDVGYDIYKYNEFSTLLIENLKNKVKDIKNEEDLIRIIRETINDTEKISIRF